MRGGIGLNRLGLGLDNRTVSVSTAVPSYSAEYQAVYDQFSSKPVAADATAQDTFVTALVGAGVWSEMDRLFILASHASGADSLLDWVNPTSTGNVATLVNAPSFVAKQGYKGDGSTSYINSQYDNTKVVNLSNDKDAVNAAFGCYVRSSEVSNTLNADIGTFYFGDFYINSNEGGTRTYIRAYEQTQAENHVAGHAKGMNIACLNQNGLNMDFYMYLNGVEQKYVLDTGPRNYFEGDWYILGARGSASTGFSPRQTSMAFMGGYLNTTKQLALYNAFQALMTYYGTQV